MQTNSSYIPQPEYNKNRVVVKYYNSVGTLVNHDEFISLHSVTMAETAATNWLTNNKGSVVIDNNGLIDRYENV